MTILDRFTKRGASYQEAFLRGDPMDSFGSSTYTGKVVTEDTALTMISVYACISLISDTISGLPLDVYRDRAGVSEKVNGPTWIRRPNTDMLSFEFWQRVITSLLINGNAYVFKVRNDLGQIIELVPVHSCNVEVRTTSLGRKYFVIGDKEYSTDEVMHIPGFIRAGELTGLAPIEVSRQAIALGLSAEEYGARFFGQGATMSGVVEVPGELNEDQAKILAKSFAAQHSGVRKSHLPGVLTDGAKWQGITIPNDQAQFLESRKFQTAEIARMYRVPPYLIGDVERSTSWGTGIEEQNRRFVEYTLQSWLVRLEAAFSDLLPMGQYLKFNLDALLRGSTKERYDAHAVGITNGFLTINEARALEDLLPVDGGDAPVRQLALGPVASSEVDIRSVIEMVQKVYLGVGKVLTPEEARELLNQAGAGLDLAVDPTLGADPTPTSPDLATRSRRRIERDEKGNITAIVEEE